jgi:hypothetical protein
LIHFAERGSQSLPDWARMIAEVARTSFPFPSWLIWRMGGHAGDAAGGLDDGDLEARDQESGVRSQDPSQDPWLMTHRTMRSTPKRPRTTSSKEPMIAPRLNID